MLGTSRKLAIAGSLWGLTLMGAIAGCSSMSSNHVDCNVVRLQTEAGRSESEIASALGVSVSDVQSCHGGEKSGNKASGGAPGPY